MLELRFGRREGDRELAQDLSVRVQRVACRAATPRTAKRATGCCSCRAVDAVEDDDWDLAVCVLDDGRDLRTDSADAIAPLASLGRVRHSRCCPCRSRHRFHGCHGMGHEVVVPPRGPRHTEVRWPKAAAPTRTVVGEPGARIALRWPSICFGGSQVRRGSLRVEVGRLRRWRSYVHARWISAGRRPARGFTYPCGWSSYSGCLVVGFGVFLVGRGVSHRRERVGFGGRFDGGHVGHPILWILVAGIVIALIVAAVVALVRHYSAPPAQSAMPAAPSSAEEVLAQRFARGEIDEDEYRHRRDALRGSCGTSAPSGWWKRPPAPNRRPVASGRGEADVRTRQH